MKNKNLHNMQSALKEAREIAMTPTERERVLKNIYNAPAQALMPVRSPYLKSFFYYASMVCSLVLILGSGAVFASGQSLPGSILYPIKTKVVEPARAALAFSPEAKLQYQSELSAERAVEADMLLRAKASRESQEESQRESRMVKKDGQNRRDQPEETLNAKTTAEESEKKKAAVRALIDRNAKNLEHATIEVRKTLSGAGKILEEREASRGEDDRREEGEKEEEKKATSPDATVRIGTEVKVNLPELGL